MLDSKNSLKKYMHASLHLDYMRNCKLIKEMIEAVKEFSYKQSDGFHPTDIEIARQAAIDSFKSAIKTLKEENNAIYKQITTNIPEVAETKEIFGEV